MPALIAADLRKAFRAIPEEQRDKQKSFSVRVWRALSWLERAEAAAEVEDRFIALWISFNALYGQLGEDNRSLPDRETWQSFLARVWKMDNDGRLWPILRDKQVPVLGLLGNHWLAYEFWLSPEHDHAADLQVKVKELLKVYGRGNMLPVLEKVFDRIYVQRLQLFHGASTKGSYLNRRTLTTCTNLLGEFIPVIMSIMIAAGPAVDWGPLCFPPIETAETVRRRATAKAGGRLK
jgi:hypothetical protein